MSFQIKRKFAGNTSDSPPDAKTDPAAYLACGALKQLDADFALVMIVKGKDIKASTSGGGSMENAMELMALCRDTLNAIMAQEKGGLKDD